VSRRNGTPALDPAGPVRIPFGPSEAEPAPAGTCTRTPGDDNSFLRSSHRGRGFDRLESDIRGHSSGRICDILCASRWPLGERYALALGAYQRDPRRRSAVLATGSTAGARTSRLGHRPGVRGHQQGDLRERPLCGAPHERACLLCRTAGDRAFRSALLVPSVARTRRAVGVAARSAAAAALDRAGCGVSSRSVNTTRVGGPDRCVLMPSTWSMPAAWLFRRGVSMSAGPTGDRRGRRSCPGG
jgi:hypothetical protein